MHIVASGAVKTGTVRANFRDKRYTLPRLAVDLAVAGRRAGQPIRCDNAARSPALAFYGLPASAGARRAAAIKQCNAN